MINAFLEIIRNIGIILVGVFAICVPIAFLLAFIDEKVKGDFKKHDK